MAKWFTYGELIKSATADKLGIDNTPKEEYIQDNIIELMRFLDGLRAAWTIKCKEECWGTAAIRVNSGYRCKALNDTIKGSKTSAHMTGNAADIEPVNGKNKEFHRFTEKYLLDNHIPFDNLINEYNYSWTHIGLKNNKGEQRRLSFSLP
jgi:hypothetical protein